jgi:DNA processing protein
MLAVVGSRNASLQGTETAFDIARTLGEAGWTIVSGLALGIDAAAHQGALETSGGTLAVLGCGIDRIYPRRHQGLADQVLACGALLSELPPGTPPAAAFFPQRNRLIAGLAHGVVVVEAALQSGSLITARLANEGGREVFAVPGPIRSSLSRGCHQLIRDVATLIESAAQILEVCPPPDPRSRPREGPTPKPDASEQAPKRPAPPHDPLQERILRALEGGAAHADQLARHLEIPVHELAAPLLSLELQGRLVTDAQGQLSPCVPGRQLASAQFRLL